MDLQDLTEKIMEHNPLDFGNIFGRSIELFKKVWLQGFFDPVTDFRIDPSFLHTLLYTLDFSGHN